MSAPHPALEWLLSPPSRHVRIRHTWGHGDWHDADRAAYLQSVCDDYNSRYGAGTHYLEWDS